MGAGTGTGLLGSRFNAAKRGVWRRTWNKTAKMFGVDNGSTGRKAGLGRAVVAVAAGVGATETGVCEDCPPTNILHAAYVGALELLKSMVAVSGRDVDKFEIPLEEEAAGGRLFECN